MKKIIVFLFVVSICSAVFAVNKEVVYNKATKQAIAVRVSENTSKDTTRKDIVCEGGIVIYGANENAEIISIDDKSIPNNIVGGEYSIDTDKKEISKK